jgi:hypothetical protein
MKSTFGRIGILVSCLLATLPALAGTIPVRGSSRNGENGSAAFWAALGPTQALTLAKGTTQVMFKQQVVCPSQDFGNASNPSDTQSAGACESGSYMFIFQLLSTATNVNVVLSGIKGFTPDANNPNYGVLLCDSPQNTLELCTNATADQLPAISFTTNASNTTATFSIPSFPNFPAGTNHQGRGLTIFVLTQQTTERPVSVPRITLQ